MDPIADPARAGYQALARAQGAASAFDAWNEAEPAEHHERWQRICLLMMAQHWEHVTGEDSAAIAELYREEAELSTGRQAAAEWRWAAAQRAGTGEAAVGLFWALRPVYGHIHQFARSRLVAPWAVLGAALARITTVVPPSVRLPPIVGGQASINVFVALVGPPGSGKNASTSVARDAIETPRIDIVPLGSGEGLSHMFMRRPRPTKDDPNPDLEQYRECCLVTIGEIDTFMSVAGRQGSTLGAQIRQAAMGEELGFFYVDQAKRMIVPEHSYRLCCVAGIQPKRAGAILVGPEADGGTPQRFVWLPALDPTLAERAEEPPPMRWDPPAWPDGNIGVCQLAWDHVTAQRIAAVRSGVEEMEAHATLMRLRIAAVLAIVDGRTTIAEDDWHISKIIMDVSALTREHCVQVLCQAAAERNRKQGEAEAIRAALLEDSADERALQRVCNTIVRKLAAAGGPLPAGVVRRAVAGRDRRDHFDAAIERLLGTVIAIDAESQGKASVSYRLMEQRSP